MQVVLLWVVVLSGVARIALVPVGRAGLALDVEERRVGQERRRGQRQRVLPVAVAVAVAVGGRVAVVGVRVRRGLRRGERVAVLRRVLHRRCKR